MLTLDDQVDEMNDAAFYALSTLIKEKPELTPQSLNALIIARNLERVGDHATNIAEDVIFWVRGKDVRHNAAIASAASRRSYCRSPGGRSTTKTRAARGSRAPGESVRADRPPTAAKHAGVGLELRRVGGPLLPPGSRPGPIRPVDCGLVVDDPQIVFARGVRLRARPEDAVYADRRRRCSSFRSSARP